MTSTTTRFPIPQEQIQSAIRCEKGYACLEDGPLCTVSARLGQAEAVLVCCHDPKPCAYKTGHYTKGGVSLSVCSCPVRLAFHRLLER